MSSSLDHSNPLHPTGILQTRTSHPKNPLDGVIEMRLCWKASFCFMRLHVCWHEVVRNPNSVPLENSDTDWGQERMCARLWNAASLLGRSPLRDVLAPLRSASFDQFQSVDTLLVVINFVHPTDTRTHHAWTLPPPPPPVPSLSPPPSIFCFLHTRDHIFNRTFEPTHTYTPCVNVHHKQSGRLNRRRGGHT